MSEPTFKGYFKKSPTAITAVDPELAQFMAKKLAGWGQLNDYVKSPEAREAIVNFASLPAMQPTSAYQLGTGVGFVQAPVIGDLLLPPWVGGANEQASYAVFGGEKFVSDNSLIALAAKPRRVDVTLNWTNVKLDVFTLEVATDRRELDAAGLLPISLDSYKLDVLKQQLVNEREKAQAAFILNANNYASTNKATLAGSGTDGTAPWSDPNGYPIDNVYKAKAKMRKSKTRRLPDTFWMGDDVFQALSFNAQIKELVKYSGTKFDIGTGVPASAIAALFNLRIVIGGAGTTPFAGGTPTDVWSNYAGLLVVAPGEVITPRFGITVTSAGYPLTGAYEDKTVGPKGGTVQKYADAWSLELTTPFTNGVKDTTSTAGYLWTGASAVL
jgi:hypothetical protein